MSLPESPNLIEYSSDRRQYRVGIVVPTLGTRLEYLIESLTSIRKVDNCHIAIVAPDPTHIQLNVDSMLFDSIVVDPGGGLSCAINLGIESLPNSVVYVNWLGDDDLLVSDTLRIAVEYLDTHQNTVLVYGGCRYIGPRGEELWVNHSGSYAKYLMRFGPQLIPQPGSLFRRSSYNQVGGLNPIYKWAFDLDLLIKLSRVGRLHYTPHVLASFRWHDGSLSVGSRAGSVSEASTIRRQSLPSMLKALSILWEWSIRQAILYAGKRLSRRSSKFTK